MKNKNDSNNNRSNMERITMIKRIINTLEKLLKLEALKLIDFSVSVLKGFNFKIEFFEQKKGAKEKQ